MPREPAALVLTSGRGQDRSALAAVRALSAAGYLPVVGTSDKDSLAAASRHAAGSFPLPDPVSEGFAAAVADRASKTGAVAVFASSDDALLALEPQLNSLLDKSLLADSSAAAGLQVAPTIKYPTARDLVAAGDTAPYPAVIKPTIKQPGLPPYAAAGPNEVLVDDHIGEVIAQPFLEGKRDAICGVMWSGTLVASVRQEYVRTWPRVCGTGSSAVVVPPDPERTAALAQLLSGHNGIFQAQFIGGTLIDLNPRVYGSMALAVGAGLNLPAIVCRLSTGETVDAIPIQVGSSYRWIEGDLRNRWQALRAGEASIGGVARDLAPKRGTQHSLVSWSDPRPTYTRLRSAASARRKDSA